MANPEHVAKLKEGVKAWNQWRKANPRVGADLSRADLREADLSGAYLRGANLSGAYLSQTNFEGAKVAFIIFADIDLSVAEGLETIQHIGPSPIGIDTIYRFGGKIPDIFLRGCGVPENFITYA
ncbi:MAG: pentapeptide repeat-containing protein, partial [Acidobacteriota bacterium]|nr:pentapeptide repeat-containing protein [Acidobacteriota bacterium]